MSSNLEKLQHYESSSISCNNVYDGVNCFKNITCEKCEVAHLCVYNYYGEAKDEYTCYECDIKKVCKYAFDRYNLNGDCLASK